LGAQFKNLQVGLQPHVYVAQPQNKVHGEMLKTSHKAGRSFGKGRHQNSGRSNLQDCRDVDKDAAGRRRRKGNASGQWSGNETMDDTCKDVGGQLSGGKKAGGGVKETSLFQTFLNDDALQ